MFLLWPEAVAWTAVRSHMFGERLRNANQIARHRARRVACYSLFQGIPRRIGYYRKNNPPRFICETECSLCRPYPWAKGWTKRRWEFRRNFEGAGYVR